MSVSGSSLSSVKSARMSLPPLASALCTMQARKAVLYVKSRTPRLLRPETPCALTPLGRSSALCLPLNLRIDTWYTELRYIRYNNKSTCENALVTCLGPFDDLGTQDDIETARHTACWDLVGVFLNAYFLPIAEPTLINVELPLSSVLANWVPAHDRLGILELLLDIANRGRARRAGECTVQQLWSNLTRSSDRTVNRDELANAVGTHIPDTRNQTEVVEADRKVSVDQARRSCGSNVCVEVEVVGHVGVDEIEQCAAKVRHETVVLIADSACQYIVVTKDVAEINEEGGAVVVAKSIDLIDVDGVLHLFTVGIGGARQRLVDEAFEELSETFADTLTDFVNNGGDVLSVYGSARTRTTWCSLSSMTEREASPLMVLASSSY